MSIALRGQTRLWKKKAKGKCFRDYYIIYLILFYSFNAMLNFLQKHLVVCNSRLILGTIAVSESVRLTPVKSGMILNRTTTTPFRVNELVTFYELNSRLLAYMLIPCP